MSNSRDNVIGSNGPVPEEFWEQLQQWLQFGGRLSSENDHIRQQIANMQARKERLLAYKATYFQMTDTQSQLIESLSARISYNQNQTRPSYSRQIDPTLSINSLSTPAPDAATNKIELESRASAFQLSENECTSEGKT